AAASGVPGADAFVSAARPAYWILTGCAAAVLVFGTVTTGRRAARSTARVTGLFDAGDPAPEGPHVTGASTR
ncbi:MFS transporter, partial [Actinomadura bangladeshensis]|nr:MFS transporter [Actinomadura bangladeshensis]